MFVGLVSWPSCTAKTVIFDITQKLLTQTLSYLHCNSHVSTMDLFHFIIHTTFIDLNFAGGSLRLWKAKPVNVIFCFQLIRMKFVVLRQSKLQHPNTTFNIPILLSTSQYYFKHPSLLSTSQYYFQHPNLLSTSQPTFNIPVLLSTSQYYFQHPNTTFKQKLVNQGK